MGIDQYWHGIRQHCSATPRHSIPPGRPVLLASASLEPVATVSLGNGHSWFFPRHGLLLIAVVSKGGAHYAHYYLLFGRDCGRSCRWYSGTYFQGSIRFYALL